MITILTLIAIVISGAVVLTMNGRLIYVHVHVHASTNPPAGFCSYHPDACTGPVTSRDAALAKVSGMMKRISGGTLPAHIDVTNMTVDQADQLLSGPTGLPSGTPVWYVRIYNPVTLTHSTPVVSSHPSDFNYARGAA